MAHKMTMEDLQGIFEELNTLRLELAGDCYDCGKAVEVVVEMVDPETGETHIDGGAVWMDRYMNGETKVTEFTLKCKECHEKDPVLHDVECEVFSRVVGYLRPISQWNPGKVSEFEDRKLFEVKE